MSRVKLEIPDSFPFATEVPIRITDINYGGHLGNDSMLAIIHEARIRFLAKHGFTELNVCGAGMIQADAVIIYKSEAFYGDILRISVALGDFTSSGCDFIFLLENAETGREIARAKTGIVFFDYERRKLLRVPEKFKSLR